MQGKRQSKGEGTVPNNLVEGLFTEQEIRNRVLDKDPLRFNSMGMKDRSFDEGIMECLLFLRYSF